MKKNFFLWISVIALLIIAIVVGFVLLGEDTQRNGEDQAVNSFEECVAAGNPVMESYPRQCRADGMTFTEEIGNEVEKSDLITVNNPRPNQTVSSPLAVSGEARGFWFFEATFPVMLLDANGNVLVEYYATAEDEWMTEEFVPYSTILEFSTPSTETGLLILERSNPSGLPENEDALTVPVRFSNFDETANEDTLICIDQCGNGTCEEIVCQGTGCPCAETPVTCPQDCPEE